MSLVEPFLNVDNLSVSFRTDDGNFKAVDCVSFSISRGAVLGIVGESGCGKTISSLSLLKLLPSNAFISSGSIIFEGEDLVNLSNKTMCTIRGRKIAYIPQDPLTSLNPLFTIGNQLLEVVFLHSGLEKKQGIERAIEVLEQVRIPDPRGIMDVYPHQLSGGMRQRVIIAMALLCNPKLLIADEPTTALDVTVQAQILNLIKDIQRSTDMSIVLITHDLGLVAEMCDDVVVLYAGQVVEYSTMREMLKNPLHPYTSALLDSLPKSKDKLLEQIDGQPPSIFEVLPGCKFEPRCKKRLPECKQGVPELLSVQCGHQVRCVLYK